MRTRLSNADAESALTSTAKPISLFNIPPPGILLSLTWFYTVLSPRNCVAVATVLRRTVLKKKKKLNQKLYRFLFAA
jgi:hypothetical protein